VKQKDRLVFFALIKRMEVEEHSSFEYRISVLRKLFSDIGFDVNVEWDEVDEVDDGVEK